MQFGDAVAYFHIEGNRTVRVSGEAPAAAEHAAWLEREPAYGNIAELGLGVLAELGVKPVGELLLDEKLGLHVAFGRSDHFGGQVGAAAFSHAGAVVHIDRVYLPELQPRVQPRAVDLVFENGERLALMRDGVLRERRVQRLSADSPPGRATATDRFATGVPDFHQAPDVVQHGKSTSAAQSARVHSQSRKPVKTQGPRSNPW